VEVMHENSPTTRDYREDRVRIFFNDEGKVASPPHAG